MKFKLGDKVVIIDNNSFYYHDVGTVVEICKYQRNPYKVQTDDGEIINYFYRETDLELFEEESRMKVSHPTKLKKKIEITYDNLSEDDMRSFLSDATYNCGVNSGQLIPGDMVRLREELIRVMFGEKDE